VVDCIFELGVDARGPLLRGVGDLEIGFELGVFEVVSFGIKGARLRDAMAAGVRRAKEAAGGLARLLRVSPFYSSRRRRQTPLPQGERP